MNQLIKITNPLRRKIGNFIFRYICRVFSNSDLVTSYHSLIAQNQNLEKKQSQLINNIELLKQSISNKKANSNLCQGQLFRASNSQVIKRIQAKIQTNKPLNVIFLVYFTEHWMALDSVYQAYLKDNQYRVTVVTLPRKTLKSNGDYEYAKENYQHLSGLGYQVISGYNWGKQQWLDLNDLDPDLIFLNSPWEDVIPPSYRIAVISSLALTCYVTYGFMLANIEKCQYDQPFHHYCWRLFYPTPIHIEIASKHRNVEHKYISLGYPKFDQYHISKPDPWKLERKPGLKRIIWAPHWILNGEYQHAKSMFMELKDYFYQLVVNHPDIELMLKPHPGLWDNLIRCRLMTKHQIEAYKRKFVKLKNAQIYEGSDYIPYFKYSDGLILDSLSFMAEYLPTGKPQIFTGNQSTHQFNQIGKSIYKTLYHTTSLNQLTTLINKVILHQNDPKKSDRLSVYRTLNQKPKHNIGKAIKEYVEKNIMQEIKK